MTTPTFSSSLAQAIAELVTFKRLEGYDYTAQATSLHYFDAFLVRQNYQLTSLSRQIVEDYIASTTHLAPNARYSRLSATRVLSRHLRQTRPESYLLHELPVERPSLPRWYLYSPKSTEIGTNSLPDSFGSWSPHRRRDQLFRNPPSVTSMW